MAFERVELDSVPVGTMVYDAAHCPLGIVCVWLSMNGNRAAKPHRGINNGKREDRFQYRREILYREAKRSGVYVVVLSGGNAQ